MTDECGQSKTGLHSWIYTEACGVIHHSRITVRKCEHCGKLEACYTDQAHSLWGYVPISNATTYKEDRKNDRRRKER